MSIVVLLDTVERNLVVEAFRCGAYMVSSRDPTPSRHCANASSACRKVKCGPASAELQFVLEALVNPIPIETRALPNSRPLSKREDEIAHMVAEGFSNREISERLDLSEHTIKNYLFRVFEKLGVSTRVELTLYALKRGKVPRTRPPSAAKPEPRLVGKARTKQTENGKLVSCYPVCIKAI